MTSLPEPSPIRELRGIDRAAFDSQVRPAGQPVVMRAVAEHWPAIAAGRAGDQAAADYFLSFGPTRPVRVILAQPEEGGRFFYTKDMTELNFARREVAMAYFFDRLINHEKISSRPNAVALQSEIIPTLLPGFVEANPMPLLDATVAPRVWIGNRISVAAHYDLAENIGVVVTGRRRFTLYPPDQTANMYPGPLELTPAGTPVSLVDIAAPDLMRFPRFAAAAATAQVATLDPGDAIYIPFGWWHAVDSLDPVSAFVNYWYAQNDGTTPSPYAALMLTIAAIHNLPPAHRETWQRLFDHYAFARDHDPAAHIPAAAKGLLGPPDPQMFAILRHTLAQMLSE